MAALFFEIGSAVRPGLLNAAIDHTVIGVLDGSVFERTSAEFGAFGGSALREVLGAQSGVQPGLGREIKGVAKDKAFGVGLTDYGEEDSGLANFFAGGSGGVGQPD